MGVCKDPSVKHLAKFGYNVIMHPKAAIRPLMLIGERDGARDLIGTVDQLLTGASAPLPAISEGGDAAGISGKKTNKLELSLGLDILGSVIGALGGSKLGVTAAYSHAKSVEFSYTDVSSETINVIDLGDYLASGTPRFDHPILAQYLEDPGNLYVITEIVRSKALGVTAFNKKGASIGVDVPVISGAVGGKIKLGGDSEGTGKVDYKGDSHLAFGFKAFELSTMKAPSGRVLRIAPVKAGNVLMMAAAEKTAKARIAPVMFPSLVIDLEMKTLD
jgi:hypothetical protein